MGLEVATYVNDLVTSNPDGADQKGQGDDHIRLLKQVIKNTFPNLAGAAWRVQAKSSNYTVLTTDNMTVLQCTAALTLALTAAATLGNKCLFIVYASGGDVVIDPNSTELVNGAATLTVPTGYFAIVVCDGSAFYAMLMSSAPPALLAASALLSAANVFTTDQTIRLSDDTAGEGPVLYLDRLSATPAVNDLLAAIAWKFRDSGANVTVGAKIGAKLLDPVDTTEDVALFFQAIVAGTLTTAFWMQQGIWANGLSDPGTGKIDSKGYKLNSKTFPTVAIVSEVQADGTDAGGSTGGGTFDKRAINTESDPDGIVSLASNEFTLGAGTYILRGRAPFNAQNGNSARTKLRNVTDAIDYLGESGKAAGSGLNTNIYLDVVVTVTIAASKAFALYTAMSNAAPTNGLGSHDNMTLGSEVYSTVEIIQIA